jgi:hypothetical protein
MIRLTIKETQNPTILKFEFPDFITQNQSFEFKNIDDAKTSPLAQQLFYLPFVKTVYISGNFIAIERYNIVEWDDVKDAVAEQIEISSTMAASLSRQPKLQRNNPSPFTAKPRPTRLRSNSWSTKWSPRPPSNSKASMTPNLRHWRANSSISRTSKKFSSTKTTSR